VLEDLPDGSTVLQLYVTVINQGASTTLTGWELSANFPYGRRTALHIRNRDPLPGRPVRPSLVAATSTEPLPTGEDDGLLWFRFLKTAAAALEITPLTLTVHGHRGKITSTSVDLQALAAEGRDTIRHGSAEPTFVAPRPKEPVSAEHRDMLQGVAGCLLSYVRASVTAFYGKKGDERKAQSFQEHFPDVPGQVDTWNARIDARERARDDLRGWVASRLHALKYDQPPFGGPLDSPIAAEALADVPRLVFREVHGCLQLGPYVIVVLPSMKDLDPNWGEVPDVDRERVERELQEIAVEAAGRPERQRARDADKSLPEVGDPLAAELELIQAKDVINGLGDCELCQ
jgi:hypothetical protein